MLRLLAAMWIRVEMRRLLRLSIGVKKGMSFQVDASSPLDGKVVASLNARASLLSESGVGLRIVGEGPLVPLFRLAYLRRRWLGGTDVSYRTAPDATVVALDDEFELVA